MFKPGDKVKIKGATFHWGTVIHQTDNRVIWSCVVCSGMRCENLEEDLELVE